MLLMVHRAGSSGVYLKILPWHATSSNHDHIFSATKKQVPKPAIRFLLLSSLSSLWSSRFHSSHNYWFFFFFFVRATVDAFKEQTVRKSAYAHVYSSLLWGKKDTQKTDTSWKSVKDQHGSGMQQRGGCDVMPNTSAVTCGQIDYSGFNFIISNGDEVD